MRVNINSFTGGEIAPYLEGRTDLPSLARGCRLLRNMVPRSTGGAFRRPGFLYQWTAKYSDRECCILPFNFSDEDSFVLEVGHEYLRFGKDGALIESGGNPYEIAAEWQEDELFQIKFVQVNDILWGAHPARSPFQLVREADDNWTLSSLQDLIEDEADGSGNAWPPMMDENVTTTTLTASATAIGPATLTASAALFNALHEGSLWEITHRRATAFNELVIPIFPPAQATMDFRVQPIEGQQFTIAGSIYTWKGSGSVSGAYQIKIGTDVETSRDNAVNAINGDGDPSSGDAPGPGTAPNPNVEAFIEEITASNQAAQGILTGDGTNRLSSPNLGGTVNVVVTVGTIKYGFMANPVDALFNGATYNVKMGATEKESLNNLVKAVNASGTNGVDYWGPSGVTANPDATAALTADNQVTVTARTGGTAGNSVATTVSDTILNPEPLNWGAATLTAGGGSTSYRLRVESREVGESGNDITIGGMTVGVLTSNNTLLANNDTITLGTKVYRARDVNNVLGGGAAAFTQANDFLIGATADATLQSWIHAVNLTGTPGTDYEATTTINADAFAGSAPTADHQVLVSSKAIDPAVAVVTTKSTATAADLTWGAATLQRQWNSATLTGGADIDMSSEGFEVLGSYKIFSYGTWKGTVVLERRVTLAGVTPETWEVIRQWRGNNDRNIVEQGEAESPEFLRLRLIDGAGTASADVDVPRFVIEADDVRIYGLIKITAVTSPTVAQIEIIRALFSTEATTLWSEGAWSDYRGWPQMVAVHEQRLVFGGTLNEPERIWASATGDFLNFRRSTFDGGSWTRTLAADESSRIVWGASLGGSLVVGKPEEDWIMTSGSGDASITPSNALAREQSQYGSANLQPLKIASRLVFAQEGGRNLLEYAFSWESQNFNAVDLTELCQHLTLEGIKQLDWAKRPNELICLVTQDNKLITITYKRREDGSVIAAAYHPVEGEIESVAVINGDNAMDDIYVVAKRSINGSTYRFIERMDNRTHLALERSNSLYQQWVAEVSDANWDAYMAERVLLTYLDCSVRATSVSPTVTFPGFGHLEGRSVTVVADGSLHPDVTVTGGVITLTRNASVVLAGIPFTSQLEPATFDLQLQEGTSIAKFWKVSELSIRFYLTGAAQYSDSPADSTKWSVTVREPSDPSNSPIKLYSGIKNLAITGTYNSDIRCWVGTSGTEPMCILGIIPVFSIS